MPAKSGRTVQEQTAEWFPRPRRPSKPRTYSPGSEITDDGFFLDENGNRPGDKESRDETEQNMHPGVFLEHHECFMDGVLDGGAAEGMK